MPIDAALSLAVKIENWIQKFLLYFFTLASESSIDWLIRFVHHSTQSRRMTRLSDEIGRYRGVKLRNTDKFIQAPGTASTVIIVSTD